MLHKIAARADRGPTLAAGETMMVAASVVIASDYFKNFVGILKSFFGGRLATHEALMDRARREALCRIKEKALAWGAHEIVRVRYETSFLDQLGVEVSAYGTAVKK
ncbi:MAG: YbjQ family protein [Bdellovibrionales bacterium]